MAVSEFGDEFTNINKSNFPLFWFYSFGNYSNVVVIVDINDLIFELIQLVEGEGVLKLKNEGEFTD